MYLVHPSDEEYAVYMTGSSVYKTTNNVSS